MTLKELYNYAVDHNLENLDLSFNLDVGRNLVSLKIDSMYKSINNELRFILA